MECDGILLLLATIALAREARNGYTMQKRNDVNSSGDFTVAIEASISIKYSNAINGAILKLQAQSSHTISQDNYQREDRKE